MFLDEKLDPNHRQYILDLLHTYRSTRPHNRVEYDHMSVSMFKKYVPPLESSQKRKQVAIDKFMDGETHLKSQNLYVRLQSVSCPQVGQIDQPVLMVASRKIRQILGTFSIEKMLSLGRHGPGSTFAVRGSDVSLPRKFEARDVTSEFHQVARGLLADLPHWSGNLAGTDLPVCPLLETVIGGRFSSVKKDAEEERGIVSEPTINQWFQQAIGLMIRDCLKRHTVDLDDSSLNQRLAKLGSITNDLATADLSNASNLQSTALVKALVPSDWFFWMDITRSRRVLVDGKIVHLEKFTSQGNGFTFDLESLIFYALTWAVTVLEGFNPFWVNVFGDDIVFPSGAWERFNRVFHQVGFIVNTKKSFFDGPFRESCGCDYYLGEPVRGPYLKKMETFSDVMKIHNRLYAWNRRCRIVDSGDVDLRDLLHSLRQFCGPFMKPIPSGLGDVGVHHSFDECCPSLFARGWDSFRITIVQPLLRKREIKDRSALVARLSQMSSFNRNDFSLRVEPVGFRYLEIASFWEEGSFK